MTESRGALPESLKMMRTGDSGTWKELVFEVDGVDDNSAWRGRPFFNYCNQALCPRCCLFSGLWLRHHTAFTNSDGMLHDVVPRHHAV